MNSFTVIHCEFHPAGFKVPLLGTQTRGQHSSSENYPPVFSSVHYDAPLETRSRPLFNAGGSEGGHLLSNTMVPVLLLEVGATRVRQEAAEEGGGGGGDGKGAGGGGQEGAWLSWREVVQLQVSVQLKPRR